MTIAPISIAISVATEYEDGEPTGVPHTVTITATYTESAGDDAGIRGLDIHEAQALMESAIGRADKQLTLDLKVTELPNDADIV